MRTMPGILMLLTVSVCLEACSPRVPEVLAAASSVTRREALEISRAYTTMAWNGSARNIRHGEDKDGIRFAAGADCSGFISRCWRLDRPFSTRELPALCTLLPSWEALRTGDILIAPGCHALLFLQREGTAENKFPGSEAAPRPVWKYGEHVFSRPSLEKRGYLPMRYRGMLLPRIPPMPGPGTKSAPPSGNGGAL